MTQALEFIIDMFYTFFDFLASIVFEVQGQKVSYLGIVVATMLIAMVIGIFWKGAKV